MLKQLLQKLPFEQRCNYIVISGNEKALIALEIEQHRR